MGAVRSQAAADRARSGEFVQLAYLCNRYPAVSHSFIRREILAIEAEGCPVVRLSIREGDRNLVDSADREESARTFTVLAQGWVVILVSALLVLLRHPLRAVQTLLLALRSNGPGWKRRIRAVAYFA